MWGSGSVEVKRKMEAKQNMLENGTVRAREKHTLDLSATPSSGSVRGPKLNSRRIFVWCRIGDHRFVVKLAVWKLGRGIYRRLLLRRRGASETLVNGGRRAFPVTNERSVGVGSPRETTVWRQRGAYISSLTIWLVVTLI